MIQYEYFLLEMSNSAPYRETTVKNIKSVTCDDDRMFVEISKAGNEGWQMVSYTVRKDWNVYWFQRPKAPPVTKANPLEI